MKSSYRRNLKNMQFIPGCFKWLQLPEKYAGASVRRYGWKEI